MPPPVFRPEILEIGQLGKEASGSPGVPVPANRRLLGLRFEVEPNIPTQIIRPQGSKAPTGHVAAKESCNIAISGETGLNDLAYVASMLLEQETIAGFGGANRYTFFPSDIDADTFNTFTGERGSSIAASRIAGIIGDELQLTFHPTRTIETRGRLMGKILTEEGVTMTSSPTVVPLVPMSPRGTSVYFADDEAGLAAGKIYPLETMWRIANRQTGVYTNDADEPSYSGTVERGFDITGSITVSQGSEAQAFMTYVRDGSKHMIQWVWEGPIITGSTPYRLEITMPCTVREARRQAAQDVHCGVYTLQSVDDSTFGGSCRWRIDTDMAVIG
jgi:hypothetical protein